MSDEGGGFDLCECVWGHEMAMRRLLNVLRNSQTLCTDGECLVDDATPPRQTTNTPDQVLLMSIIFVTMLFLYYFRPRPQRLEGPSKPSKNETGPPNPPPATN